MAYGGGHRIDRDGRLVGFPELDGVSFVSIASNGPENLAIADNGDIYNWFRGGSTLRPMLVDGLRASAVSMGRNCVVAFDANGDVLAGDTLRSAYVELKLPVQYNPVVPQGDPIALVIRHEPSLVTLIRYPRLKFTASGLDTTYDEDMTFATGKYSHGDLVVEMAPVFVSRWSAGTNLIVRTDAEVGSRRRFTLFTTPRIDHTFDPRLIEEEGLIVGDVYFDVTSPVAGGDGCIEGAWSAPNSCGSTISYEFSPTGTGRSVNDDCAGVCGALVFPYRWSVNGNTALLEYTEPPGVTCSRFDGPQFPPQPADDTFSFECSENSLLIHGALGDLTLRRQ